MIQLVKLVQVVKLAQSVTFPELLELVRWLVQLVSQSVSPLVT